MVVPVVASSISGGPRGLTVRPPIPGDLDRLASEGRFIGKVVVMDIAAMDAKIDGASRCSGWSSIENVLEPLASGGAVSSIIVQASPQLIMQQ